ncbi:thioredoxin TrxC [Aromatoleum toluvorans]|uniref:Thioredoxin n=1 Tax=Aromatoleum toluvorans TaxID=92002 RepID=A0ABX1PVN3_9RHOO|nr:thioredoxin TrxC [Aromatoleum toluvorans]NMG43408.1 thioredoxin TrxC [Aromatoleum toluvorans]
MSVDTLTLPCPDCDALNRVPSARLNDEPICGKCRAPLFARKPLTLTAANFAQHVERSDLPVLVDFWAPWCGPCRMMAPAFEEAARMLEPQMRLAKVNTEEIQELAARFGIRSIPTMILFRNGQEVARQSGAMNAGAIAHWARSHAL